MLVLPHSEGNMRVVGRVLKFKVIRNPRSLLGIRGLNRIVMSTQIMKLWNRITFWNLNLSFLRFLYFRNSSLLWRKAMITLNIPKTIHQKVQIQDINLYLTLNNRNAMKNPITITMISSSSIVLPMLKEMQPPLIRVGTFPLWCITQVLKTKLVKKRTITTNLVRKTISRMVQCSRLALKHFSQTRS